MPNWLYQLAPLLWFALPGAVLLVVAIIYWPWRSKARCQRRTRSQRRPQPDWVATSIDRLNADSPNALPHPLPPNSVHFEHWVIEWYTPASGVAGYFLIGRVYGDPLVDDRLAVYVGPVTMVCGCIVNVQGYWVVLGRPGYWYQSHVTNPEAPLSHITGGQIIHYTSLERMATLTESALPPDLLSAELMRSIGELEEQP